MATGTTLTVLLDMLRKELGSSSDPAIAQSEREILVHQLNRAQRFYYAKPNWPHLRVRSDKLTAAGQRYYDAPSDIDIDKIAKVQVKWGDTWHDVVRGIEAGHYNSVDSDDDVRLDPVLRWDVIDVGSGPQIEFWPIPATDDLTVRFDGVKKLTTLVSGSDTALLDDDLIVLTAAAKLLARFGADDAEEAATAARSHFLSLVGNSVKRRPGNNPSFASGPRQPQRRTHEVVAVHKES